MCGVVYFVSRAERAGGAWGVIDGVLFSGLYVCVTRVSARGEIKGVETTKGRKFDS